MRDGRKQTVMRQDWARNDLLFSLVALCLATGVAAHTASAASVSENLALGAFRIASAKLHGEPENVGGLQLLRFGLALDPESKRGLLLQAKLDRDQDTDVDDFDDGGRKYVEYVLKVAKGTSSRTRRLLLYKVVEIVTPENETALMELTKAKNKGVDTSFDALMSVISPKTDKDDGDAPVQANAVAPDDQVPVEAGGKSVEDVLALLAKTPLRQSVYHCVREGISTLNGVNEANARRGAAVVFNSKTHPRVQSLHTSHSAPYYTGSLAWPMGRMGSTANYYSPNRQSQDYAATAFDWLQLTAAVYGLAWKGTDRGIALVDKDDPDALALTGINAGAEKLADLSKSDPREFISQYKGKKILVSGFVSGIGRGMSKQFVHLADDRVRVFIDVDAKAEKLAKLRDTYQSLETHRRDDANRNYGGNNSIFFAGEGVCGSISRGRIMVTECSSFSWFSYRKGD